MVNIHPQFSEEQLKLNRLKKERDLIRKNQRYRRTSMIWFHLFTLLYFLPLSLISMVFLFPFKKVKHRNSYSFLRNYFKHYFNFIGMFHYEVYPIPQRFKKPTLIFTTRVNTMSSAFLYTLFKQPVHIPIIKGLTVFPISIFFPFFRLNYHFSNSGYEDQDCINNLTEIKSTLKKNQTVVVYVNKGFVTPTFSDTLTIYKEIFDLLNTNIECYFLPMTGFGFLPSTSFKTPESAKTVWISKEDLLGKKKNQSIEEKAKKIMSLFEFKLAEII